MVYVLWLVFMGLILGFVAVPVAQRIGYSYGRFGRTSVLVAVVIGTVIGGLLLIGLAGAIGASISGEAGTIIGGLIGAAITMIVLGAVATRAASDEPNTQDDIG